MKFSVPGNDDFQSMPPPWLPVTPQKPLPLKPQPITPPNWQHQNQHQLGDTYNGINKAFSPTLHFRRNVGSYGVDGGLALQDHVASSYSQPLGSESSSWNGGSYIKLLVEENAPTNWNLSTSFDMAANAPPTPLLHSQMASPRNYTGNVWLTNQNCSNGSYSSSRPTVSRFGNSQEQSNVANWLLNDNYSSSSHLLSNGQSSTHISQNVPMPLQGLGYDLNYTPRTEADTTSCGPSQLQFTPYRTSLAGESSRKEKGKQVDFFTATGDVAIQDGGELLQTVVESACAAISTPYKENKDSDKDGDGDIDINETPLSKTPKRRKKYMPKVIIEGKPKRTPKPASEEPQTGKRKYVRKSIQKESSSQPADGIVEATEEPRTGKRKYVRKNTQKESSSQLADGTVEATEELRTGKRKYVRKNTQKESLSQLADGTGKAAYHYAGKGRKSCRRVLEFDLETTTVGKGKAASNNQSKMISAEVIDLETEVTVENQGLETTSHPSMSHFPSDYIILPERPESAVHIATRGDTHITNFHISADGQYEYAPIPQHSYNGRIGQHTMGGKTDGENHEKTEAGVNHSAYLSALKALSAANEGRGSKREYFHTLQKNDLYANDLSSSLLCQEIIELDGHQESSYTTSKASHKKQKVNNQYSSIHDMSFKAATVEEGHGRVESKRPCDANSNGFAAALNHTILKSYIGSNRMEGEINGENKSNCNSCKENNQVLSFSTNSIVESCKQLVSSPPRKSSGRRKKQVLQNQEPELATILESVSGTDKLLQKQDFVCDQQQSSERPIELPLRTIYPACMDDIIHQLSVLSINASCNERPEQEKNKLVPYRGDGAVVPYTGSEYIKKRKPRPKVELDSETNRIWNLLMGKEGSEGTEGPDKQKEKYWEEERKVFRGRVDSFIARMHLVQGDRRFSRWKGSVVDSVIGVFLTQNVSDHLSSSAFMSLAARFPVRSVSNHQTQDKVGTAMLVKEPEVCIQIPDDATKWSELMTSQPIYNPILMAPYESAEHQRDSETSRTEKNLMDERSKCLEDEFVSSQDSFGSSITQGSAGIRSYSVSNSRTEDPTARLQSKKEALDRDIAFQQFYHEVQGCPQLDDGTRQRHKPKTRSDGIDDLNCTCSITNLINLDNQKMQPSISPSSSNHLYMYQNSGESEPFGLESFSEDSISSCWQTATKVNMEKDGNHKSFRNKQLSGTLVSSSVEQSSLWAAIKDPYGVLRTDQQHYSQPKSSYEYYQPSCNIHHHDGNQTFRLEEESFIESVKHSEGLPGKKNDTVQHVPNFNQLKKKSSNAVDSISTANNGSVYSNTEPSSHEQPQNEIITKASKGRKKKSESDKNNTVEWDNLRKQVMADGRKKEKNTDAMDSLDYEALRNDNVKEISNAIRERGMNNMLAKRIQEFLNRVVKDHGSIDLEWLRDVPPEKAKDYLLSIRGLGLKSVECVRLLTLHHLAFPVDTNVGRIAVRLGWVPLQPLPESLQLHLLELYPMLESIQKYLWPRLCKLDQLTLYELHYQMITFGKVFCTKSKPNCNACPMRGECRHFASAFASARLALPGPEEKSIVSSTSTVPEKIPPVPGNVMSLPPPGNYLLQEVGTHRSEPIIEEPATPEQEFTNLSESDIEDLYNEYEDPDEIPTINVSIQQFTDALQNYMQKNMDIQEGDMSKALVALNPQAASLPTPKLKNVSRLRTEHQVYELPDSHPLLQGMDIREPDDPSPYLLAIWTPGETAHSFQPPESRCGSQDGNTLCSEKTCFSCNSIREEKSQIVRGTILTPCRTAMRGSFPLNGTYFQVNEMFADHASSVNPIDVPRGWIWNLPRRPVYFGTSVTSIFRGLSTEGIQHCFWRGYVCVRGFDRNTRAPKPLIARLHFPQSKLAKKKDDN